ncbi:MAG: type II secretion system F family protein [Bacteriovoracaceae bacterium]|nr:type II secretion system F family protein [Bacteriovoracaceae bacterium]
MANWRWEGIDKNGKKNSGVVQATNAKEVRQALRAIQVKPRKIISPSIFEFDINEWLVQKGFAKPFGGKELTNFTKQLATMVNAGVPLLQSLEILYKQEKHPVLKRTVKNITTNVGEGKTLAESMMLEQGFDKLYCNMVKAGETGGILDTILGKLADHMDKQQKTISQIKAAMMYPALISVVGAVVVWGMLTFVVPQFSDMLISNGQELPAITQFVVNVSDFLNEYLMYMIPSIVFIAIFLKAYIGTPQGKMAYDHFSMKLPLFGGIVIKGNLSSFTRTLSTMLTSGIPLINALDICIETLDNSVISNDIREVKKLVVEGKTMSEPLSKIEYFPAMVTQMVRVGEQTGGLDDMLLKVSEVFEDEVETLITGMTKLVEPLILVVLGGIVGVILIAMYLPMFMSAG